MGQRATHPPGGSPAKVPRLSIGTLGLANLLRAPESRPAVPLHAWECRRGLSDLDRMRVQLSADPGSLNREDDLLTPLADACSRGHVECVRFLLKAGAKVKDSQHHDLLLLALEYDVAKDTLDIVKLLLLNGATPECDSLLKRNLTKTTYLELAIFCEPKELAPYLVRLLLEYGASTEDFLYIQKFDSVFGYNGTLAAKALHNWRLGCLKELLLHGALTDARRAPVQLNARAKEIVSLPLQLTFSTRLTLKQKMNVLHLIHQFGANFWERTKSGYHRPIDFLRNPGLLAEARRSWGIFGTSHDLTDVERLQFAEAMQRCMSEPLSLLSLSRLAVLRANTGRMYRRKIDTLPITFNLKCFMRFYDC